MVSLQDLRGIVLFDDLTDEMLEKLCPISEKESMDDRHIVYEAGGSPDHFYSLKRGKVLLEAELASEFIISVGAIKPGYSFGWSALFPATIHSSYAICAEPSEVIIMPAAKFSEVLSGDHTMGFFVMKKAARILENRVERRTAQFLKVISKHPEISMLLGM